MWILRSLNDAEGGPYTFRMTAGRIRTMGRGPRADFVLDAALVSRIHCRFVVRDEALTVENLGSTNGTYVNNQSVDQATLRAGDIVRAGRVELTVSTE